MISTEIIAARSILKTWLGKPTSQMSLSSVKLSGGTEAAGVYRVLASLEADSGRRHQRRLIVKHLTGRARREAGILRDLLTRDDRRLLPDLLGVFHDSKGHVYLGLEEVRRTSAWPWRNSGITAIMMRQLGQFHAQNRDAVLSDDWNYEEELGAQAEQTRAYLDHCCRKPELEALRPGLRTIEKIAEALPRLRQCLLREAPFEARLIHGDVHPGNTLVRKGADMQPVLIDWGRTRLASPLEDVSSMLQSLRLYEPSALQLHDMLFKEYLTGMGREQRITDGLRSAYWVAGASNALAGALRWHLMIAADDDKSKLRRRRAYAAALDWLRVIRRAHAWAL
jgi:serine/threonine protein kinase